MPEPETTRRQWVVRDESKEIVCAVYAKSQEEAIGIFCHPALDRMAYFGPDSKWTCEEYP